MMLWRWCLRYDNAQVIVVMRENSMVLIVSLQRIKLVALAQ